MKGGGLDRLGKSIQRKLKISIKGEVDLLLEN